MRVRLAAVTSAVAVLVGFFGAPVAPVLVGAGLASAWLLWR